MDATSTVGSATSQAARPVRIQTSVQVAAGATQEVVVEIQPQPAVEETVTVVASTRTDKRLEDQPMRVEVLAREECRRMRVQGDLAVAWGR